MSARGHRRCALGTKSEFLETFDRLELDPCGLTDRTMFPGPTGPNAVEAGVKLARFVLMHPDLDAFSPGEHNGTFRGNNLAFVTAERALSNFWSDDRLAREVAEKSTVLGNRLTALADQFGGLKKGRGFIQGVSFADPGWATGAVPTGLPARPDRGDCGTPRRGWNSPLEPMNGGSTSGQEHHVGAEIFRICCLPSLRHTLARGWR
jgi:4-aminobutyrate aminotransferase-like enzyme